MGTHAIRLMDVSVLAPLTRLDASASPADAVAALAAMCSLDSPPYSTGISQPPKGTMRAPSERWRA